MTDLKSLETLADVVLYFNQCFEDEESDYDRHPEITLAESGDWVDDGKYSFRSDIYYHKNTNSYWDVTQSRSGSYFSDYYYDKPNLYRVEPKEVKTIQWVVVK